MLRASKRLARAMRRVLIYVVGPAGTKLEDQLKHF